MMKLGFRISVGFGLLVLLLAISGGVGLLLMRSARDDAHRMTQAELPSLLIAADLQGQSARMMTALAGYRYTERDTYRGELETRLNEVEQTLGTGKDLLGSVHLPRLENDIRTAESHLQTYRRGMLRLHEALNQMNTLRARLTQTQRTAREALDTVTNAQRAALTRDLAGDAAAEQIQGHLQRTARTEEALLALVEINNTALRAQVEREPAVLEEAAENFSAFQRLLEDVQQLTQADDQINLLRTVRESAAQYEQVMRELATAWFARLEMDAQMDAAALAIVRLADSLAEHEMISASTEARSLAESLDAASVVTLIGLLVGLVVGVVAAVLIIRSITGPVTAVVRCLEASVQGDSMQDVPAEHKARPDEIGLLAKSAQQLVDGERKLARMFTDVAGGNWTQEVQLRSSKDALGIAVQKMVAQINETLSSVSASIEEISAGAGQIADASQSLSQGATESAASIQQISASASEIGQQARTNAETATQANQLATTTKTSAEKGSEQMERMNSSMAAITESSAQIAHIIKAIDDIAFQTNILALNAAVEAARAGRHGKGFAVVAEEVRSLAARSAKAARETATLIEDSKGRVEEGNVIAKNTAAALTEIVGSIVKVGDLVGEMAAASNEQARGITEISQGMGQIDQVTQQNTATAEETAAASEELSGQAHELRNLIGQFQLKGAGRKSGAKQIPPSKSKGASAPKKSITDNWKALSSGTGPARQATPAPKAAAKKASSEEIISLEDSDFGRY